MVHANSDGPQERRSVIKSGSGGGGQSGQAIKLFQVPRKIGCAFQFWHKSLCCGACRVVSNNGFEWKNEGSRHALGVRTPNPHDVRPYTGSSFLLDWRSAVMYSVDGI